MEFRVPIASSNVGNNGVAMNRRSFLKKAGIAAGLFILPSATTYSRIWKPRPVTDEIVYQIDLRIDPSPGVVKNFHNLEQQVCKKFGISAEELDSLGNGCPNSHVTAPTEAEMLRKHRDKQLHLSYSNEGGQWKRTIYTV